MYTPLSLYLCFSKLFHSNNFSLLSQNIYSEIIFFIFYFHYFPFIPRLDFWFSSYIICYQYLPTPKHRGKIFSTFDTCETKGCGQTLSPHNIG